MTKVEKLWLRLNALVPQPQCLTFNDDYDRVEWRDARPQPTLAEVQAVNVTAIEARISADRAVQEAAAGEFRSLEAVAKKTDTQIGNWIDANVTDLASAKAAIRLLARGLGAVARHLAIDR